MAGTNILLSMRCCLRSAYCSCPKSGGHQGKRDKGYMRLSGTWVGGAVAVGPPGGHQGKRGGKVGVKLLKVGNSG